MKDHKILRHLGEDLRDMEAVAYRIEIDQIRGGWCVALQADGVVYAEERGTTFAEAFQRMTEELAEMVDQRQPQRVDLHQFYGVSPDWF
jgi:hypothetical protein